MPRPPGARAGSAWSAARAGQAYGTAPMRAGPRASAKESRPAWCCAAGPGSARRVPPSAGARRRLARRRCGRPRLRPARSGPARSGPARSGQRLPAGVRNCGIRNYPQARTRRWVLPGGSRPRRPRNSRLRRPRHAGNVSLFWPVCRRAGLIRPQLAPIRAGPRIPSTERADQGLGLLAHAHHAHASLLYRITVLSYSRSIERAIDRMTVRYRCSSGVRHFSPPRTDV